MAKLVAHPVVYFRHLFRENWEIGFIKLQQVTFILTYLMVQSSKSGACVLRDR